MGRSAFLETKLKRHFDKNFDNINFDNLKSMAGIATLLL